MKNTAFILAAIVLSFLGVTSAQALEHNITAVQVLIPGVGSRTPVNIGIPIKIEFRNNGTLTDTNTRVTAVVRNANGSVIYRDTQVVSLFESSTSREVTFNDFTPTTLYDYSVCGVAIVETDENRADDTACVNLRVGYEADAKAVSILVPTPDGTIPAKIGFKAKGLFSAPGIRDLFDVKARMQIRNCSNNALVIQIDSAIPELNYDDGNVPFEFPSRKGIYDTKNLKPGCYKIALICNLPDDGDRTNDTMFATFEVVNDTLAPPLAHDIRGISVIAPISGSSIQNPTTIPISMRFRNVGANDETDVKVVAWVTSPHGAVLYRDTATINSLAKGATTDVTFTTFTFPAQSNFYGSYIFAGTSLLSTEMFTADDTTRSSIILGTAQDVQVVEILDPYNGEVKPGGVAFAIKVTFRTSWGTGEIKNVPVRVQVRSCNENLLRYQADTIIPVLTIESGIFTVIFPITNGVFNTAELPAGCYRTTAFSRLSFDGNRSNDTLRNTFTISPFLSHNISAVSVTAPLDKSHGGKLIAVAVKYQNTGVNDESSVKLLAVIKDRDGNEIYRDSAYESNWISSQERTKGFRNCTLPADGLYTLYGICSMTGDVSRYDDTVLSHFSTGQVIDAEAVAVMYPIPSEIINKGTLFNPIGSFRWAGGYDDKYPVPVSVEIRRCDGNTLVYQADSILDSLRIEDEEKEVIFPTTWDGWDIRNISEGCYRVAVIATMEFDGNRKNDTAYSYLYINLLGVKTNDKASAMELRSYPNPFSTHTQMTYELPASGYTSIRLLDISGKLIETMITNKFEQAGRYNFTIDGTTLASGTYFVEVFFKDTEGRSTRTVKPIIVQKN